MNSRSEQELNLEEYLQEYAPGHTTSVADRVSLAGHIQRYDWAISCLTEKQLGGNVLDIGCGYGFGTSKMATWSSYQVIGIDFNLEVMQYAYNKYVPANPNLSFSVADATILPFPSEFFEVVTSFEVIEHLPIPQVERYLSEIKRVLKDESICFISTPNRTYRELMKREIYPFHEQEYTPEELREVLEGYFSHVTILGQQYVNQSLDGLTQTVGLSNIIRLKRFVPISVKERLNRLMNWDKKIEQNWLISQDALELSLGLMAVCYK